MVDKKTDVEAETPEVAPEIVEPTADGVTTTLDEEGNIVPIVRHEATYDHKTGAFA